MAHYLFFDTETSGLPKSFKKPYWKDLNNFPRIVSLSWFLTDDKGKILSDGDFIIKPNGFEIDKQSINTHGITQEIANEKGKELKSVLVDFLMDYEQYDNTVLVAHNIFFDFNVLYSELVRTFPNTVFNKLVPMIDTMKPLSQFVGIENFHGYKWPTLQELHYKVFNEYFINAHNSKADTKAVVNCFFEMMKSRKGYDLLIGQINWIQEDILFFIKNELRRFVDVEMYVTELKRRFDEIIKPYADAYSKSYEPTVQISNYTPTDEEMTKEMNDKEQARSFHLQNMGKIADRFNRHFGKWNKF